MGYHIPHFGGYHICTKFVQSFSLNATFSSQSAPVFSFEGDLIWCYQGLATSCICGPKGRPKWFGKGCSECAARTGLEAVWQTDWQTETSVAVVCISCIRCGLIIVTTVLSSDVAASHCGVLTHSLCVCVTVIMSEVLQWYFPPTVPLQSLISLSMNLSNASL